MMDKYQNSTDWLDRAEKVIPTGSQTFSKSKYSFPQGAAPLFAERSEGCYLIDIDDNRFIDLVNGLLSVSLGYGDSDVDRAVISQLNKGVTLSLPTKLETQLSEKLCELIPCAEQVRFGKNGTDATSAAVRLARAYTGRDQVVVCGYHGWQDWYIGSTSRDAGVPDAVKQLVHTFPYNDIESLRQLMGRLGSRVAAVIMEPMNVEEPLPGFLAEVKAACQQNGSLLIFDEMITGFRFHLGGAQSLFGVTPDLACFGKGMANGFPLSAVVGRADVMVMMEEIFFSGTFGGETLSLAAAIATIEKMERLKVPEVLAQRGHRLAEKVTTLAAHHGVEWFSLSGHPSWKIMNITGVDPVLLKSVLLQELAREGVLTIGSHNLSFALQNKHIDTIALAYDQAFFKIQKALASDQLSSLLEGEMIKPVFKVR